MVKPKAINHHTDPINLEDDKSTENEQILYHSRIIYVILQYIEDSKYVYIVPNLTCHVKQFPEPLSQDYVANTIQKRNYLCLNRDSILIPEWSTKV